MQAYDCVEYFAGASWVTRAFRLCGRPAASLDINKEQAVPGCMNSMDITTPAGMGLLDFELGSEVQPCSIWACVLSFSLHTHTHTLELVQVTESKVGPDSCLEWPRKQLLLLMCHGVFIVRANKRCYALPLHHES